MRFGELGVARHTETEGEKCQSGKEELDVLFECIHVNA
jgi:hypothetical protein